jgi:hypothetical protein
MKCRCIIPWIPVIMFPSLTQNLLHVMFFSVSLFIMQQSLNKYSQNSVFTSDPKQWYHCCIETSDATCSLVLSPALKRKCCSLWCWCAIILDCECYDPSLYLIFLCKIFRTCNLLFIIPHATRLLKLRFLCQYYWLQLNMSVAISIMLQSAK